MSPWSEEQHQQWSQQCKEIKQILQNETKCKKFSLDGVQNVALVTDVHDGDTFKLRFLHSDGVAYEMNCRSTGYNCAEINGKTEEERTKAQEAKAYVINELLGHLVHVTFGPFDAFARPLVTVHKFINETDFIPEEKSLCDKMIEAKLAQEYNGRGKKNW